MPILDPDPWAELAGVLACPRCRQTLSQAAPGFVCVGCGSAYEMGEGIPRLFSFGREQAAGADVTGTVQSFYEKNPFPNYDDLDTRESLARKAQRGIFARLLDEQIPDNALVLEAGCGTGQLTNFLGMGWNRRVIGSDMCLNSLRLAQSFRQRFGIANAAFVQMNLFFPCFADATFDVVVSNGVLHHTADPLGGMRSIARLVKPGGYLLIGLYNTIGRLTTDLRRVLFRHLGGRVAFLDGHMRNQTYNDARKLAWFMDQYEHPQESKHSFSEAIGWLETSGFEFLTMIPKLGGAGMEEDERLFEPHSKGNRASRFLTETGMLLQGGRDGALFIVIGRKARADAGAA